MTTAVEIRAYRARQNARVAAVRAAKAPVRVWTCMVCDESGAGPDADQQAARHTRKACHSTTASSKPRKEAS